MTEEIKKFWDLYQQEGIEAAVAFAKEQVGGDLLAMEQAIPFLIAEGKERDIPMIKFIEELDELEQKENADGANHDARGISPDVDSEAGESADEDESTSARDADGEDRSQDEVSIGCEDVQ